MESRRAAQEVEDAGAAIVAARAAASPSTRRTGSDGTKAEMDGWVGA
jgi:hypothetical protein